jgi:predicted SAM-dependent methyltransferase
MQLADLRRLPFLGALVDRVKAGLAPPPPPPPAPLLDRKAKTLFAIDRRGHGLEIGPSFNPLAPKSAGFDVEVLDHATAPELRDKYRGYPNVDVTRIEEVDHVWRGEALDELLGVGRYDWIIASHVIEHLPDLVSFLRQSTRLLRPGGVLSLVVPDKRYCFDYFRWPSTTGDLLQAFAEERRRHPPGVVFDHVAHIVKRGGEIAWSAQAGGELSLGHQLEEAKEAFERARSTSEYVDVHCWRFTPASFRLILTELRLLGLVELEVVCSFPTEGCEFYVTLRPSTDKPAPVDRLVLYRQAARELLEGIQEKNDGGFIG